MVNTQVATLMASVNKAVGADVLQLASDQKFIVKYIPTGLLPFDILLRGGFPRGRMTLLQGDWSTLKSYAGYCAAREVQRAGGVAAVIDTEHSFDADWATSLGINVDDLIVVRAESGEMALDAAEALVRGGIDLIVFDSVAAALPQSERDKRLHGENNQPARQAALFSLACRKLTTANDGRTAIVWISQLRENIGITFGPREKGTGGRALPFYSSYIIDIRKVGKINRDEKMYTGDKWQGTKVQIGQKFKAELLKSKLNKPFRDVWFDWSLVDGEIDNVAFLFTQGMEIGVIGLKGSSYSVGNKKVVGKEKFKTALATDTALRLKVEAAVLAHHGMQSLSSAPPKAAAKKRVQAKPMKKVLKR